MLLYSFFSTAVKFTSWRKLWKPYFEKHHLNTWKAFFDYEMALDEGMIARAKRYPKNLIERGGLL
jgi:hypothetical protein